MRLMCSPDETRLSRPLSPSDAAVLERLIATLGGGESKAMIVMAAYEAGLRAAPGDTWTARAHRLATDALYHATRILPPGHRYLAQIAQTCRRLRARMNRADSVYMAIVSVAENTGHVKKVTGPAFPAPGGWTYQGVCGLHGTLLLESESEAECQAALDAWLAET